MALKMQSLDWENAFGVPPVEPNPKLEAEMAERRANTTATYIDEKRNLTRNLVYLMFALSGLLAITGIIRQGQQHQKAQVVYSDTKR